VSTRKRRAYGSPQRTEAAEVGGWSADKYQNWLEATLVDALVDQRRRR